MAGCRCSFWTATPCSAKTTPMQMEVRGARCDRGKSGTFGLETFLNDGIDGGHSPKAVGIIIFCSSK